MTERILSGWLDTFDVDSQAMTLRPIPSAAEVMSAIMDTKYLPGGRAFPLPVVFTSEPEWGDLVLDVVDQELEVVNAVVRLAVAVNGDRGGFPAAAGIGAFGGSRLVLLQHNL